MPIFCFTGVSGLQVEELWSLDAEEFKNLGLAQKFVYRASENDIKNSD